MTTRCDLDFKNTALHPGSAEDFLDEFRNLSLARRIQCARSIDLPSLDEALTEAGNAGQDINYLVEEIDSLLNRDSVGNSTERAGVDWDTAIPFERNEGQPFPTSVLPGWIRDFVEQEAEATQTPIDMASMLSIAAISTAAAGHFEVEVRSGYTEPLNVYVAIAMPPGSRKSTVFDAVARPIFDYERKETEANASERIAAANHIKVLTKRNDELHRQASKAENEAERASLLAESRDLVLQVSECEEKAPREVRLTASDVTPERLAGLMSEHHGRIAVWTAEGGEVFEMMGGRYAANGRGNIDIYLKAHAGDVLLVDRQGPSPPLRVGNPCLTMALTMQPSVILSLKASGQFRGRGLLGRFLFSFPANTMGKRTIRTDPVRSETRSRYEANLTHLLKCEGHRSLIHVDPEALEVWFKFAERIEPGLSPDGAFGSIADWAGKLAGAVARLAALLHCGELAGLAYPTSQSINATTMRGAVRLGEYLLDHAQVGFSMMSLHETDALAQKVWRCVSRLEVDQISERDVFQKVKGGIVKSSADVKSALENLSRRGYVAKAVTQAASGRGRPASQLWLVNPNPSRGPA